MRDRFLHASDGQAGRATIAAALVGRSPAMQALRRRIARVAPTEATVLILGERGTGKELVARAIHEASPRRTRLFLAVNCAAIPPELLAAELFGHARGAFTGATERRPGLLLAAAGGTVFLDEIGDLSLAGQAMLLRFLQESEVRAVGALDTVTVDVRVIAATNKDLERATTTGDFRADLYDRLNEATIGVPPLRDRPQDIAILAEHFLDRYRRRHRRPALQLSDAAVQQLKGYTWPGNVRQLEKVISAGVIFAEGDWIRPGDLGLDGAPATQSTVEPDGVARVRAILTLAERPGGVRRRDLCIQLGLSGETIRQELIRLMQRGLLRREGRCRWARYVVPAASVELKPESAASAARGMRRPSSRYAIRRGRAKHRANRSAG